MHLIGLYPSLAVPDCDIFGLWILIFHVTIQIRNPQSGFATLLKSKVFLMIIFKDCFLLCSLCSQEIHSDEKITLPR